LTKIGRSLAITSAKRESPNTKENIIKDQKALLFFLKLAHLL